MPKPPMAYYELSKTRVVGHQEPLKAMAKYGILIDGRCGGWWQTYPAANFLENRNRADFLRVHSAQGRWLWRGQFPRALFKSIEQDQIDRGVLKAS